LKRATGKTDPDEKHSYREVEQTYGGVKQRWLLVYSTPRAKRQNVVFETRRTKAAEAATKALKALARREFACEPDAREAVTAMEKTWKYHTSEVTFESRDHFGSGGRPKKGQRPIRVSWRVRGVVVEDPAAIAASQRGRGLYMLATNEMDKQKLSARQLFLLYKSQNTTIERGFRFLKDPLFFASAMYLKKPSRIMALLMVMTLSLLVYAVAEHQLRAELAAADETVPDQTGKPTARPTLRRVFQMFDGIELLEIRIGGTLQRQVLNLSDLHRKILGFLPEEVKTLYLNPGGCGR